MSEKNQVEKDLASFDNKKLISKALNNELTFLENIKFQKLLKLDKWKDYYQKIREMENRVDNVLFSDVATSTINVDTLKKLNFPQEYLELVQEKKQEHKGRIVSFNKKVMFVCAAAIILTTGSFLYNYWDKHLAVAFVSGLAVIFLYTLNQ